jgi:uncharacterized protein DUF2252
LAARALAAADCAQDHLDRQAEDDQVSEHLSGDHQPDRLGLGGDVAEPDRRDPVTVKYSASVWVRWTPKLLADQGDDDTFAQSITNFSARYADQNERDYAEFVEAVRAGRLQAIEGV